MSITGWRCWDITEDGTLWAPISPADTDADDEWSPVPTAAICLSGKTHSVPDEQCECGWRAMPELSDLLAAARRPVRHPLLLSALITTRLAPEWYPKVIGRVELTGKILGRDSHGDPVGTVRGEIAQIISPVFLGMPFECAACLVAMIYRVDVVVSDVHQRDWVKRGLEADWHAYQNKPEVIASRTYRP